MTLQEQVADLQAQADALQDKAIGPGPAQDMQALLIGLVAVVSAMVQAVPANG